MKRREEIEEMLSRMGIPFRYYMFEEREAVGPPFMVWYLPESENIYADGAVYLKKCRLNLELYSDSKDFGLEQRVERELRRDGFAWEKTEDYLEDEEMYEVLYEMEVLMNEDWEEQDQV